MPDAAAGLPISTIDPSGFTTRNAGFPAGTIPSSSAARAMLPGAALAATAFSSAATSLATLSSAEANS